MTSRTQLENHINNDLLDFKIGLGGVAIVKEEALKIPLFQLKNPNTDLNVSGKIKEELKKMENTKPEWSRYNSFQPDWTVFQTEIKQMMLSIMEPNVRNLYENQQLCKKIETNYEKFKRRLDEMEFIFLKVARNASTYKESINRIETTAFTMKAMEASLKQERDNVISIKTQLIDQFKLLKDDRTAIFKKIDNSLFEVHNYKRQTEDF